MIIDLENIGWKETSIGRTSGRFYITQGNKENIDLLLAYLERNNTLLIEFCPGKSPSIDTGYYYDMAFEYIPGLQNSGYDMWTFPLDIETLFHNGLKTLIMYNASAFAIFHLPDSPQFAKEDKLRIYNNPKSRGDEYYDDALPFFIQGMQNILGALKVGDAIIYIEDWEMPHGPYIPFSAPQLESLVKQRFITTSLHFDTYPTGVIIEKASGEN